MRVTVDPPLLTPLLNLPPRLRLRREHPQLLTVQRAALPSVLPLLADLAADLDVVIWGDSDEAAVEEEAEVAAHQEAIADVEGT